MKGQCPLHEYLYNMFEGLFSGDEGSKLDIGKMSKANMDAILLDCLMYDDDALFERALALLYRKYQRRGSLLKIMNKIIMLDDSTVPVFGTLHALTAELRDFIYDVRTYAVWGVANQISGPLDDAMFEEVKTIRCSSS